MTIKEYITDKFLPFGVRESQIAELVIESGLSLDEEYSSSNVQAVGVAMCSLIEELALSPYQKSVSESGFSMSWDFAKIGNYYRWLCKKYGVNPNVDTLAALGLSSIVDRTSKW